MTRATGAVLQAALLVLLVAIIVLLALPRISSFDLLIVRGGSMEPTIHVGSAVLVDRSMRTPSVGFVMTFHDPTGTVVTHRVVEMSDGRIATKGDANATVDVIRRSASEMVGTVRFSIPFIGYVLYVLQQPIVFFVLLIATLGALILGQVRDIAAEVRRIHRRRGTTLAADGTESSSDA